VAAPARPLCHLLTCSDGGAVPAAAQDAVALLTDRRVDAVDAIVASHPLVTSTTSTLHAKLTWLPPELHAPALRTPVVNSSLRAPLTSEVSAPLPPLASLQHLHLTEHRERNSPPIADALLQLSALQSLHVDFIRRPAATGVVSALAAVTTLTRLHLAAPMSVQRMFSAGTLETDDGARALSAAMWLLSQVLAQLQSLTLHCLPMAAEGYECVLRSHT
jgi:hypothetical protein